MYRRYEILHWLLVEHIVPTDTLDTSGSTALHIAARTNDIKSMRLLLGVGGASADLRNKYGSTPLSQAANASPDEQYCRHACWMLIRHGSQWPTDTKGVPPDWICKMYDVRDRHLKVALIMVGIAKFNRSPLLRGGGGRDVGVLLARAILKSQIDAIL